MTYEELGDFLEKEGISLDCWLPFERSMDDGSVATGSLADIVIYHLKKEHGIEA